MSSRHALGLTAYCYDCGILQVIEDRTVQPVPGHKEIRHARVLMGCGHHCWVVVPA